METINTIFPAEPVFLQPSAHPQQPTQQAVVPAPQFTTVGTLTATLTIASAISIGSNMVDVKNGAMTTGQAVLNGMAKGAAATLIMNATARSTILQVAMAAAVLAGAGFLIDTTMKKNKEELCHLGESPAL